MSLVLTPQFAPQLNLVLPLAQNAAGSGLAVRVASTGSGSIGTLTASGATSVIWSLAQNPSWVSSTPDSANGLVLHINFISAQAQQNPYQFYISCTDGNTTQYFPILLEVREPFSIATSTGGTTLTIPSYDSTVADTLIQGIGLSGAVDTGVQFLIPAGIPPGLEVLTSTGAGLILRVAPQTLSNLSGGLSLFATSPASMQVPIQAYKPGSMYDSPDLCCSTVFTIESLSAKPGTLDVGLTMYYNLASNLFQLNAYVTFLQGQAKAFTYQWGVTGTATGAVTSYGTSTSSIMTWQASSAGLVGFYVKILNAQGVVIGQSIINPTLQVGTTGIPCAPAGSWQSSAGIKIAINTPDKYSSVGQAVPILISTPSTEFAAGEVVTLTVTASPASLESAATITTTSLTLTAGAPSVTAFMTIPASGVGEKWNVQVVASNGPTPTRTGYAQVTIESLGPPTLTVNPVAGTAIFTSTGTALTPIAFTFVNAAGVAVTPTSVSLLAAPDGVLVSGNQIVGTPTSAGTFSITAVVAAAGYGVSFSPVLTLFVAIGSTPLSIGAVTSSAASLQDGKQFNLAWGTTGTASSLILLQNFVAQRVLGSTQIVTSQVGNSVCSVFGSSFRGTAYSVPILVLSSSVTALAPLPNAPAVALIDENQNLTINFTPESVTGNYQLYRAFNIWVTALPNGIRQLQNLSSGLPTGLEPAGATLSSRIFEGAAPIGDVSLQMQALSTNPAVAPDALPWNVSLQFPTALTPSSVALNASSILRGQSVTITLDPAYVGALAWRVVYADNTSTDWLPLAYKSTTKVFNTPGAQNIIVQTLADYSGDNPAVKLMRQVTLTVYVLNQQYTNTASANPLTGDLGFGGPAGFEITSAIQASVALQPYAVLTRALVRDTLTNELKLLVATSRTNNASSLLGTMALDVFPLAGRPRVKDRLDPALLLSATSQTAITPIKIATATLPSAVVGSPLADFPMQVVLNSGLAPFSWYAVGLPPGLKLSYDGTLSGTPTQLGTSNVTFACLDSSTPGFIDETTLPLEVVTNIAIPPQTLATGIVGSSYSQQIINTGGLAPFTWSLVAGALPRGLSLNPNTGLISGSPVTYNSTTDFSKTYTVTFQVTDSIGAATTARLSMTLMPPALQFGPLDQPSLFATTAFRLRVPVFGGQSPYSLLAFSDDGVVGSGLTLASPSALLAVAGVEPPTLSLTVSTATFYPQTYPANISVPLSATGGVAPYNFLVTAASSNTLLQAAIYGNLLTGNVTADGTYLVTVACYDAVGHVASQVVSVTVQAQNTGVYTISPVQVNLNGSSLPTSWTVTPIAALPDATNNAVYAPSAGNYYGLALYKSGALHLSQSSSGMGPMVFTLLSGSLPPGVVTSSGTNFQPTMDFSGIVLFNVASGSYPTTNGSYAFEAAFTTIGTDAATLTQAVARNSISVTSAGGGTTSVIVQTSTPSLVVDLAAVSGTPFTWYCPLTAEGRYGPFGFSVQTGTTLPRATITTLNGLPAFASTATTPGAYILIVCATDSQGTQSAPITINVVLFRSATHPIHILSNSVPATMYATSVIPPQAYAINSDLLAAWSATGLPPGVTLSPSSGTTTYLAGTPTASGVFNMQVTATSVLHGSTASVMIPVQVQARTAIFLNKPTSATVGVNYRAINNTAIVQVQYTGFQPTDPALPLPATLHGILGLPGTSSAGSPTTSISSLTSTGFTMKFDYINSAVGTDTVTLGGFDAMTFAVSYAALVVAPTVAFSTVSEYSQRVSLAAPVTVTGGLAPYTYALTGFTDARFSASSNGQINLNATQFSAGGTYPCGVGVTVTDSSGLSATATGTISLTVRRETYITVNFSDYIWNQTVSSVTSFSTLLQPNLLQSVVQLGHGPYQYYIDAVTLPPALVGFIHLSPSNRVFAIQVNNTSSSATIYDVDPTLANSGTFVAAAVATSAVPLVGTYQIPIILRVVDTYGLSSLHTQTITLVLS